MVKNIENERVDDDKVRKGGGSDSIVTNFRGQTQEYTGGRYPSNDIFNYT